MQIDYDVGDCVVCVVCTPKMSEYGMKKGAIHRVGEVFQCGTELGVKFKSIGHGSYWGWKAEMFRKLPKASDEFTEQMRKLKPHKQKVDA